MRAEEGVVGESDREKGLPPPPESVEGEGGCGVDGEDGSDPAADKAEDARPADVVDVPAPPPDDAVCWVEAVEDDEPLGDSPGEAVGVGNPLSGVDPRLSEVRGNLFSGSKSCPPARQLQLNSAGWILRLMPLWPVFASGLRLRRLIGEAG